MSMILFEDFELSKHLTILNFFRKYSFFIINAEINPKAIGVPIMKMFRGSFAFYINSSSINIKNISLTFG